MESIFRVLWGSLKFRVLWEALKHLWDNLLILVLLSTLTVLLMIPVITFPPALAGLWYVANQVVNGHSAQWSDYLWGVRRYFLKAWGLALVNIVVAAVVLTNVWFYGPDVVPFDISETLTVWIRGIFIVLGLVWWCYQLYPMAMLLEQEDQRIRLALRNSAILVIANPGATLVVGVLSLLLIVLSVRIPPLLVLITPSLLAVVCNEVVVHLLKPFREKAKAEKDSGQDTSGEAGSERADHPNETG